jgi:hypothetical protein
MGIAEILKIAYAKITKGWKYIAFTLVKKAPGNGQGL